MKSLVLVSMMGMTGIARSGTIAEQIPSVQETQDWKFEASFYGWLTGLNGSTGVGVLTPNIDVSFLDIADDLKMAAALEFEIRHGRWGLITDLFYVKLGASGSTPGPIYDSVEIELQQFIGELSLAYRVIDEPSGFFDVYAGVRYQSLNLDFTGTPGPLAPPGLITSASPDKNWLDPIVGIRGHWNINEKYYIAGKSDIGGFSVGSELTWSVQATLGYRFTENLSVELGYRYLHTDYEDGSFTYDIDQAGIVTSLNFKF